MLKARFANLIRTFRGPTGGLRVVASHSYFDPVLHGYAWLTARGGPCTTCNKSASGGNHTRNDGGFVTDTAGCERCAHCNTWGPCVHPRGTR